MGHALVASLKKAADSAVLPRRCQVDLLQGLGVLGIDELMRQLGTCRLHGRETWAGNWATKQCWGGNMGMDQYLLIPRSSKQSSIFLGSFSLAISIWLWINTY